MPLWVDVMSTDSGFDWGRNGEYCIAVGSVNRAACELAEVG